jgi:hypothetical protein
MKNWLQLLTFVLIFCSISLIIGHTASVEALGAPTDNATTPSIPAGDQSQGEIKPPVEYVLVGPTSQSETTPPNIIAGFITTSGQKESVVTDDEKWYLDLDINAPGWIYIYEYFPAGQASPGQWLAYKWQLPESGLWQLGPFTPSATEAEGQHAYRVWFYSNGQWSAGNPDSPQSYLIYWTYSKGKPAGLVSPPSPTSPPTEVGFSTKVYEFFTQPVVLVACLLVVVAGLVMLVIYAWRRRTYYKVAPIDKTAYSEPSATSEAAAARATLALPNGIDIRLSGDSKVIGRGDLARALSLDDLGLISRRHFEVKLDDEQFYIEDLGSNNGTCLNDKDISGQGPISLDDNDVIEPAGMVSLKFHLL